MEKKYFIESKEQYEAIRFNWSEYLRSGKKVSAAHMMLYNIFRSKDPLLGFSPTTNEKKLANGQDRWLKTKWAISAISCCKYKGYIEGLKEPFGNSINDEDILRAWEQIKELSAKLK